MFEIWFHLLVVDLVLVELVEEVEARLIDMPIPNKCFENFFLTCRRWTHGRCSAYEKTCTLSKSYQYSGKPKTLKSKIWYSDLNRAERVKYLLTISFNIFVKENIVRMYFQTISLYSIRMNLQNRVSLTCRGGRAGTSGTAAGWSRTWINIYFNCKQMFRNFLSHLLMLNSSLMWYLPKNMTILMSIYQNSSELKTFQCKT
jgi:hypothetical protein